MRKGTLEIAACVACGMRFVPDARAGGLAADYYQTTADAFYTSDEKIRGDYNPHRYDREIRTLRRFCPGGKVLDVGCSTGGFLAQLRARFGGAYEAAGSDVAPAARRVALDHGVRTIESDFLSASFPEHGFDAITFWAVLEHLVAPGAYFAQAADLLRPDGLCFVVVPNIDSLAVRLLGRRYRYILPEHLNYFNRRTLCRLAEARFSPVYVATSHFNPIVIAQDFFRKSPPQAQERAQLLNRTNRWKGMPALAPVRAIYRFADQSLGALGLGDNVLAVLRKR